MKYSVLDLFAGCGGLGDGFKRNKHFEINLASDIWEAARDSYVYNNPNTPFILSDIKNLDEKCIEKYYPKGVQIIIGGPPCQGFSMCGVRDIGDTRNDLFYEYARLVNITKPYIFLMENVKGMLSMKNKENKLVIEEIYKEFDKIGYTVIHNILNAKDYNVAQARERVIFIGIRNDLPKNYIYPQKSHNLVTVADALEGLPNKDSLDGEMFVELKRNNEFLASIKGTGNIYNHTIPSHKEEVTYRMSLVPQGGNWKNIPEEFRVGGIHSNSYRRLSADSPSVTIKHAYKSMIIHPKYDRCLSVREVARIQSFNDDYIFKNSKTSQYQQLANAVPPNLSKKLAESIYEYLNSNNICDNQVNSNPIIGS